MDLRTFRAATMQEALMLVRRELGSEAAVLHTRQVRGSWLDLLLGRRQIEVTASRDVNVPSRLRSARQRNAAAAGGGVPACPPDGAKLNHHQVQGQISALQAMVAEFCRRSKCAAVGECQEVLARFFAELRNAEMSEDLARELVARIQDHPCTASVRSTKHQTESARKQTTVKSEISL